MSAMPPENPGQQVSSEVQSYPPDAGWHWHDAALIVFERRDAGRSEYAVGAVDLYANAQTGDLGGSYLELGAFSDLDRAADQYSRLQTTVDEQMLLPFQLADYLDRRLQDIAHKPEWRTAGPAEYAAYEAMRSIDFAEPVISADYAFASGITEDGEPALQAVKRWPDGAEIREARQTLDTYGMNDEAAAAARELNTLLETDGLDKAMELAESIAIASGQLQPGDDGIKLFHEGPPDPFTSEQPLDPVRQFQDAFADGQTRLLEPVDPVVNYSFDVVEPDPYTIELRANKWWIGEDGALRHDGLTVNSYSLESFEFERESEREIAAMNRDDLEQTHRGEGLEASMRKAEALAVTNGELDPHREDGRLFYEGPLDRFTTLREAELAGREQAEVALERDEWQELLDRAENDQPEPERHYWQLHHRPVETPEGEPLGTALVMIEFPQLPLDFGAYLEEHGMNDSIYPTQARTLEMGHFANEEASKKFETEFRGYLVSGILEGPDLAPEVAKLEGLSGKWEDLDYSDIVEFMRSDQAVIRDIMDVHEHNPQTERGSQELVHSSRMDIDF
jgi:hypothetical protein